MQTIQLDIEDHKVETFLTLIENLKEGMIHNLTVSKKTPVDTQMQSYLDSPQFQKDKAMLQQRVADIDSGKTICMPWEEGLKELDSFIDSVS